MSATPPRIRRAAPADAAALAVLFTELGYPSSSDDLHRRLPRLIASRAHRVLVAEDERGAVVGCMHLGFEDTLVTDREAQIMGMVVASTHRRRGIGRALVGAGEDWARAQGGTAVRVRTNAVRKEAPAFYAGLGYLLAKTQLAFRKKLGP